MAYKDLETPDKKAYNESLPKEFTIGKMVHGLDSQDEDSADFGDRNYSSMMAASQVTESAHVTF